MTCFKCFHPPHLICLQGKRYFPNEVCLPCKKRWFFFWLRFFFAVVPSFRDLFNHNFLSFPPANLRRCSHRFHNLFGNKDQSLPKHSYFFPSFSSIIFFLRGNKNTKQNTFKKKHSLFGLLQKKHGFLDNFWWGGARVGLQWIYQIQKKTIKRC